MRYLIFCQLKEFVDKDILQVLVLCCILVVDLGQEHLVLLLSLTGLDGTGEELLVDDDTGKRRVGLQ